MRVQLRRPSRDERGAVAIMAALVSVLLIVSSAFAVDLGRAYVSKRQLQTAADAGALAAALTYKGQTSPCSTLINDATLKANAQKAANAWAEQNYAGVTGATIQLSCPSSTSLTVTYGTSGSTPQTFSQLVTGHSSITTSQTSAATIGQSYPTTGGLRPWGMCTRAINNTGIVVQVSAGNKANTDCPSIGSSGTWNRYACPGYSKGNANQTADWIQNGCPGPDAAPIPGQAAYSTPTSLGSYVSTYCTGSKNDPSDTHCLTRDTGNINNKAYDAWATLIGKTIVVPVFCTTPECSADAQGPNEQFPIHALATVEVCGYNLEGHVSTGWPSDDCTTQNPNNWSANSATSPSGSSATYYIVRSYNTGDPATSWGTQGTVELTK